MYRIVNFLLVVCFCVSMEGQITIPVSHIPAIGDVFTFGLHNQVYTPKPLTEGVFDFSDLQQNDTTVFRYVANDKTIEYPTANLKLTEDDNDQATVYFKKEGNDLFLISLAQIQQQIAIPGISGLKGTMQYLSLPITNSTNITSSDEIATIIPKSMLQGFVNVDSLAATIIPGATVDSLRLIIKLTLNLFSDGSGKIKTPIDNNIDVIKVVRKISVTPKLALYGKAFGFPISNLDITNLLGGQLPVDNFNLTTHAYYSPSFRQEIVTATLDSTGKYETVNYRYRTKNGVITNQIESEKTELLDFELVDGKIVVKNWSPSQTALVTVVSMDGRKLQEKIVAANDATMSLNNWNGIRVISVMNKSGIVTKKIFTQ